MNATASSIINGESREIIESGYATAIEEKRRFKKSKKSKKGESVTLATKNEGISGFSAQQNDGVATSSHPETGYKKMDIGSDSFSLFDKISSRVRFISPDNCNIDQDILNKILGSCLYENVDVKRVVKMQDIHDKYCPTCNLYFTKRDTLPRKDISPDYEDDICQEADQSPSLSRNDSSFDASTCFRISTTTGISDLSAQQNDHVTASSLPETNAGYQEMDVGSDSFGLFDKFASRGRVILPDNFNIEQDILNKNLVSCQHEDVDVKRVVNMQDTHDKYCPTCNLYFTKRDSLPRKDISPDYEEVIYLEADQSRLLSRNYSCFDATTCLSCFRSSVPTGDSFLFWKFKSEADATDQPGEVTVSMPEVMQPCSSVTGPLPDNQVPLLGRQPECRRPGLSGMEIIKAIVYGGLLESITSLSIVVSAAGGKATTLNIVGLGFANVFGGFLMLANNLKALKNQTSEQYEDQLGQPRHFLIHAIIAIISYLVFGLMFPLIYGFSFYKSDNKYLKLATLGATSVICLTLLSTAKVYVQRPPKAYIQTVFYYISLGFMVSGIAYIVGDLINMLLAKLI